MREQREPLPALAGRAAARRGSVSGAGRFRQAPREARRRQRHRRVQAALAVARRAAGGLRSGRDRARLRRRRSRGDLGADRADVLRRLARPPARRCAQPLRVPLLRKDFVVSEYQIARGAGSRRRRGAADRGGADAGGAAGALPARAASLGLDVLVEVHDADELDAAIDAGARIVGVNNRNLRTLEVNVQASEARDRAACRRRGRGQRERPEDGRGPGAPAPARLPRVPDRRAVHDGARSRAGAARRLLAACARCS